MVDIFRIMLGKHASAEIRLKDLARTCFNNIL